MAQFLRGKQAGIQKDLSEGLSPDLFLLDEFARCGINSQISVVAYDPVQSLLAVGTSDTQFGSGQIYVFGQRRVLVVFNFPRKASARFLQFCGDKLVSVDSRNEISIFSLETKSVLVSYAPPGHVTALLTDPSLDYAFIGLQNGDIIAYDMDRESLTPFRVPNLWAERNSRTRLTPVISMAFSPRDIGKILVGYPEGAVVFSFKQNLAQKYFEYEVPSGALGGDSGIPFNDVRKPKVTQVLWHPNGIFVLTVHDDTSLVLWDSKDGRKLMARTIQDINVDQPGAVSGRPGSAGGLLETKHPITKVAWCAKQNADNTGLLVAGGGLKDEPGNGLTFLDFGTTPNYQTSSWQILSNYFDTVKTTTSLAVPPGAQVVDFCLLPRSSPYYAGAHDPIAVMVLLSSGELVTLSFPSGHPITPTNMLHPYLSFVQPFVTKISMAPIDRSAWLGLKERRQQGPRFLVGGAEGKKTLKRFERRNIIIAAHADGTIRLWDAGNDDEIENGEVIQVDLSRAVGRVSNVEVTQMSMVGLTGELSVGLRSGEVVIFRWGNNANVGSDAPAGPNSGPGALTNIKHRTDPGLKQGLLPLTMLEMEKGPVTALKHSEVGFVAVGFEGGSFVIIDLRGPAIIYTAHLSDFLKQNKRASFRKSRASDEAPAEWPTSIEFGVMTLEGEEYSSICCFVGTSRGNFATFKILPASNGTYSASFVGATSLDDKVISISPLDVETGSPALASPNAVGGLRNGLKVNGVVVAVTVSGCRIFKPATAKGAHKTWDNYLCDSAAVVKTEGRGYSLVGLFGDGNARAFSIPSLKEIGCSKIDHIVDMRRISESLVAPSGDILTWVGPSEVEVLSVWGFGVTLQPSDDKLYNDQLPMPPRPTISNMQWISGTQYISPADMDILIGGPDRPPSKKMLEQMKLDEQERQQLTRNSRSSTGHSSQQGSEEGYMAYMQRQMQERTERLGIMGDTMDRLEENSSNWADDVSKFVSKQKKKAVLGVLGSKFGL
ncbi:hypothetical protein ASPZODRAFT_12429 [Penicilliopsis zonata CBS 506.65]|uniref:Lethal giant larvae (Lgl)-like C-terminal domain-containing protein n=1 Tax=Penicilliopsis zonata CBS 506.65 TaxID=1073090 RepID=A0A1L9SX29_9EURO|nr:hypothetical protein ASPZODRAFT_12429 [Penicilliopsis zonata CBS 506.65]OJJ51613.1 hypothetical protein ASPZODRAFT_12429 [Penicilliopsis zonata CBS 506.65]